MMQEKIKAQREQLIKMRDYIDKEIAAHDATLKLYERLDLKNETEKEVIKNM